MVCKYICCTPVNCQVLLLLKSDGGFPGRYYWIKGMESGYLNSSPLEAFTEATAMHTTLSIHKAAISGIPIIIKHNGISRIVYSNTESWKLRAFLPFSLIHVDSSLLLSQQIIGPSIPPKGTINPEYAERWQNIAQVRSLSDKTLISFMAFLFYIKDVAGVNMMHHLYLASLLRSSSRKAFGLLLFILC